MKTWRLRFSSYKTPDDIFDLIVSGKKLSNQGKEKHPVAIKLRGCKNW
jgi:hypothetical protein